MTSFIEVDGNRLDIVDLRTCMGATLDRMPWIHRILLENVLRHRSDADPAPSRSAFTEWLEKGTSSEEIEFFPGRVLMHDTTYVPALVDIAAMRDVLAETGIGDPARLDLRVPVDVSVDHSVAVDAYGTSAAFALNMANEMARNAERYRFMRWAAATMKGLTIHPPGSGIMHTINLERLATVIATDIRCGSRWAMPDTLVGTDSHTPMIGGIGVLAWGVGGLEAESVLFGMPVTLRLPDVIGVRLNGVLSEGVTATDLALHMAERLRGQSAAGAFVEFFGAGVETVSAGARATIANMAPEYGAAGCYFPIDARTLRYLQATGRDRSLIRLVETYAKRQALWFDPAARPRYSDEIAIDLSAIRTSLAGPRRPHDRLTPDQLPRSLAESRGRALARRCNQRTEVPDGAVAIAAITSCTNTSDLEPVITAGLVARKARALGLKPPHWVKTSLAPGSPAARRQLERASLMDDLAAIGFDVVAHGCTTCIGNSGPLTPDMANAIETRDITPVAILSGNRNFPGRVHAELESAYLASPPLVVAFALAGDANRDIVAEPIGHTKSGGAVFLSDLWPNSAEIEAALAQATLPDDYASAYRLAAANPAWHDLDAPAGALFPWDEASNHLRRPPFVSPDTMSRLGRYTALPLVVLGDDITTDHISPAGQIPADSLAGEYLQSRGVSPTKLNVYAAHRGNWEVMLRGLFTNRTVVNHLCPAAAPGRALHCPSGDLLPLWQAAERYRSDGQSVVLVAGERFGTGSSRDWAAKGQALLGVRAVLANSIEPIHRSNLIGVGILPLLLPPSIHATALGLVPGDCIAIDADEKTLAPRASIEIRIRRIGGAVETLSAKAAVETTLEADLLRSGGTISFILKRAVS